MKTLFPFRPNTVYLVIESRRVPYRSDLRTWHATTRKEAECIRRMKMHEARLLGHCGAWGTKLRYVIYTYRSVAR